MNKEYYNVNGMHPEDAIYKIRTFIRELQKVQNEYFSKLSSDLNLTKEGEDWLFDYVHNSDDEYDGFDHYLNDFKKNYDDMIKKDIMFSDSSETFLSTDFGEFIQITHMSSFEPDLDTSFPSAYNYEEPFSLELDSITSNNKS